MRKRLEPFLTLLDARYLPLLFAAAPQSYAIFLWLWRGSERTTADQVFAILGALGFEMVYIGAIAWTEVGHRSWWMWITAGAALLFSVLVAGYVYQGQCTAAWLHAGFPVVAFCYTMNVHSSAKAAMTRQPQASTEASTAQSAQLSDADIVRLYDEEGMSYADIGKLMNGVTRQAVSARYQRAKSARLVATNGHSVEVG